MIQCRMRNYILQTYTQNAAVSWFLIGRSNEQGAVSFTMVSPQAICDQVCRVILSLIGRPTVQSVVKVSRNGPERRTGNRF